MVQVSFTNEYVKKDAARFEKVKVEKGETDRVAIVTAPERYFVHQMNMPDVDIASGEVIMETMKNAKGEEYEREKTEFVGSYICTGKDEVVGGPDGFDAENCTLCAAIKEHGDKKFRRPEPKYACYVIKYRVNGSGEVQLDPFQAELLLWVFTQNRFENIIRIANEHGDPMKLDLLLGPCKNTTFQAYDIAAGGKCHWRADKDRMEIVAKMLQSNKVNTDEGKQITKNTVARTYTPTQAEMAINKVLDRHNLIGKPGGLGGTTASAIEFGGVASASKQAEQGSSWGESSKSEDATPDFLKEDSSKEEPKAEASAEASSDDDGDEELSFDDIMAQLG